MTNFRNLVIAPLNAAHDRVGFRCNVEALDQYIHKQAGQDIRRRISRIFVAALPDNPKEVMGYYSLSTLSTEAIAGKTGQEVAEASSPRCSDWQTGSQ